MCRCSGIFLITVMPHCSIGQLSSRVGQCDLGQLELLSPHFLFCIMGLFIAMLRGYCKDEITHKNILIYAWPIVSIQ